MYYNTILQVMASLTNVVGTTYAILSILKLKPKDLYQTLTLEGMNRSDDSLLTQKKQARIGMSLVIYAWILQALFSFWMITNTIVFILCLIAYGVLAGVLCLILFWVNKNFENRYHKLKKEWEKENPHKHEDLHTYGEF